MGRRTKSSGTFWAFAFLHVFVARKLRTTFQDISIFCRLEAKHDEFLWLLRCRMRPVECTRFLHNQARSEEAVTSRSSYLTCWIRMDVVGQATWKPHWIHIEFVSANDAFGKENPKKKTQMVWEFKFCEWNSGVFPHPNNRQKSHFALKVSDMMGGWQRMLENGVRNLRQQQWKKKLWSTLEARKLRIFLQKTLLRPSPLGYPFLLKKTCSNPEKIVMIRPIPNQTHFSLQIHPKRKTQPETNQRTNPPNCNHRHHRDVCPRCQEDQADRWSGKNVAPTFFEEKSIGSFLVMFLRKSRWKRCFVEYWDPNFSHLFHDFFR